MILNAISRDFADVRATTNQLACYMNPQNIPDLFAPKYIDPMADFGFKKIFKESGQKQLLIRPLNAIFGLDIADIDIRDGERLGDTPEDRSACFDLFCVATDGKKFIVEVQLLHQEHFLEIRRFDKKMEECADFEEQFLYMMKNIPTFAERPDVWEDPYFRTMLDEAEFARMSRQQKERYRKNMRRDWDYKNTMDYAIARGREEGRAEGISQEQRAIARRMLSDGLPAEVVAKYTALTESQIADLKTAAGPATEPIG